MLRGECDGNAGRLGDGRMAGGLDVSGRVCASESGLSALRDWVFVLRAWVLALRAGIFATQMPIFLPRAGV